MSGLEVDSSLSVTAKCDVSNDVDGIKKDQAQVVGNGEIEGKISPVVAVKHKSVKDTSDARSQLDVNAASPEEPVREKHDTSGSSSSPVKRKQVRETSDSETEESGSPTKKPRSEVADHFSDHSTKMSDEDMDSSSKTSPKKQKLKKKKPALDDDDEEELEPGLLERPIVLEEGQKREKKKVQRLEFSPGESKQRRVSLEEGSGTKLGDIPRVEFQLQKTHWDDLKPLHRILYDRVASAFELKKNIRGFSGFTFGEDSADKKKKVEKLTKFSLTMLKSICETLDIERAGKKDEIIEKIISFLMKPKSSGKPLPSSTKKRRRSSKSQKGSAKKTKKSKKSKSKKSEEPEHESDADDESNKSGAESDEAEGKGDDDDDAESPKPAKKKKKDKTPVKRTPKAEKKTPKSSSAKKVKKPPKKTKVTTSSGESSDDDGDEPLVKKKVPPTDDMLKSVVKKILKTANLEEVTMKTVCKQVYDKFPEFDLTSRKDFIKATVKQILK